MDTFRVLFRSLPLYSRICTTDDGCLRMLLPMLVRRYAPRSHSQTSKLVYFSGYVFRTLRLISCACAYQADSVTRDIKTPSERSVHNTYVLRKNMDQDSQCSGNLLLATDSYKVRIERRTAPKNVERSWILN